MRTIAHLSDLHFGVSDPDVARALVRWVNTRAPSLTVVSGDLTQRARRRQFSAAQNFLQQLKSPQLVVPGNHDIPLFDLFRRFRAPLSFYQRFISADLDPIYTDDEIVVQGLNTARPTTWQTGRVSPAQLQKIRQVFSTEDSRIKVLVTHHPLLRVLGVDSEPVAIRPAGEIVAECQAQGVDLLLAGHFHRSYSDNIESAYGPSPKSLYAVRAGTAISRRLRGEPNAINWITLDDKTIRVETHRWNGRDFTLAETQVFPRTSLHFS